MSIIVPKLLQSSVAKKLNDDLLKNNKSFTFLDVPTRLLKLPQSTYYDAFFQYSISLYKLYHDYGMYFLQSFICEAKRNLKLAYRGHIDAIYAFRAVLVHSDDGKKAFKNLKNYYFRNDVDFTYKNWDDFWSSATEKQWKHLIEKLVGDSNLLYDDLLYKVSINDPDFNVFSQNITTIFEKGIFKNENSEDISLYEKSFDFRFLKRICGILYDTTDLSTYNDYSRYAKQFYEQNDIISNNMKIRIIDKIKTALIAGELSDSNRLFDFIKQVVEEEIRSQMVQHNMAESIELLD